MPTPGIPGATTTLAPATPPRIARPTHSGPRKSSGSQPSASFSSSAAVAATAAAACGSATAPATVACHTRRCRSTTLSLSRSAQPAVGLIAVRPICWRPRSPRRPRKPRAMGQCYVRTQTGATCPSPRADRCPRGRACRMRRLRAKLAAVMHVVEFSCRREFLDLVFHHNVRQRSRACGSHPRRPRKAQAETLNVSGTGAAIVWPVPSCFVCDQHVHGNTLKWTARLQHHNFDPNATPATDSTPSICLRFQIQGLDCMCFRG